MEEKKLNGLEMPDADLRRASFVYRELRGANFRAADLTAASLQGCDLRASDLSGARLDRTTFYLADLRGANLSNAQVNGSYFQQARLEGADLSGVDLSNSDLRATYDDSTVWPNGFDAVAAGAVHVGQGTPEETKASTMMPSTPNPAVQGTLRDKAQHS